MNVLSIFRDACFFYSRNLAAIIRLCLPWILLESGTRLIVDQLLGKGAMPAQELLVGLVFYPFYVGALILYLDARSRGFDPTVREVLARALRLWPALAVLAGLSTLLIMLGASLFVLPGIWIMVRMAFAEYLLVLRGMTPLAALKESFVLTRGRFLLVLGCTLIVLLPVWLLEAGLAASLWHGDTPPGALAVLVDSGLGLLQLLATVVLFRCYMLCSGPAAAADER
ncbi:hypothetical protein MST27_19080 [Pseudomonas sp. PS1]|uniref:Uncharacterized protein n=1 Tax=Stutzerimonas marianensis TaxID=2929513 RepID=A0A9X1W561_9GAMM|nr:YciC family protein [Pseudomonas marianensis]MCJ0975476.1 hypothetical protein [Pseudomonas marianensis]